MAVLKALPPELIDGLLAGYQKPKDLIGEHGLLKQLTKALVERALQAEMAEHLGHGKQKWPHSFEQQPKFFKWTLC